MLAVLMQALFAMPLAVRMATDTVWSARFGVVLCTGASHDGGAAPDKAPAPPLSPHAHDQCLICHGSAMPFGTLVAAAIVLTVLSSLLLAEPAIRHGPPRPHHRFAPYRSRAPPVVA